MISEMGTEYTLQRKTISPGEDCKTTKNHKTTKSTKKNDKRTEKRRKHKITKTQDYENLSI